MIYWFEHRGMRYRIHEGETLVGRGGKSTLFIDQASVSREHARVVRTADRIEITDLGSSNGTFINGERLTGTREIRTGDEVRLGVAVLTIGASESRIVSSVAPAIQIIERRAAPTQREVSTEPEFSSVEVLESLVAGHDAADDPSEIARMIMSSVDRLLDGVERRKSRINADVAARVRAIAESVAGWFPDATHDAWLQKVVSRLRQ